MRAWLAGWPQWAINTAYVVFVLAVTALLFWIDGRIEAARKRAGRPRYCWSNVLAIIVSSLVIGVSLGQTTLAEWTPDEVTLAWAGFWLFVQGVGLGGQKLEV